ncbi:E3 SUMO-protein ligase ZNF451 isoform X2 [Scleropages formosus]|uniref:E3 SUMO-protein ligase ZNF451 isoform X2 n=1 Tax=Scleropages formosus TaxID=113540 RepID=UPI0010FA7682|nr:E3 SUMO-protein ligase ZNF451 isoform X2 [Scleropages formosus]
MASSPVAEDPEEEVQFVSEGPLRPVLECIDLLSDVEDEDRKTVPETIEEQIDRQKAQVASTLDRLARQVAVKKQERAEKCKAFKEKIISQQAHGRQELAFSRSNGDNYDAKRCVDIWLKMPGLKPGVLNSGAKWGRRRPSPHPIPQDKAHTCPVINCGRVYDSVPLLEGHLKRFDHSPCDPTVLLRGSPSALYACVACCRHFDTKEAWRVHLRSKTSSPSADGHTSTLTCQMILCFACPACYLLFNIRDECLQHMAAKNHFVHSIRDGFNDTNATATPIPIPRYAKNRLIALCKEVAFRVRCTLCKKVLGSHMEARAHFNVHCRQGGAIAESDRTVAEIMKELQAQGHCSQCQEIFCDQGQIERHKQLTEHEVEVISTVEKSVLHYCNYYESLRSQKSMTSRSERVNPESALKKEKDAEDFNNWSPAKRRKLSLKEEPGAEGTVAWFCECGLRFSEESSASKHLMAANQIFLKCGVCGKQMGESSIARLHMSRFHGGAHLSNFFFWCHRCRVEMPRQRDILSHISDAHRGHTFYKEQEVMEQEEKEEDEPSSSSMPSSSAESRKSGAPRILPTTPSEKWLCRMCEDLFESQAAVKKHCRDVSSHSFQRFLCGHCPQRFFKEATVRRHCSNEHGGRVSVRYFCGLCDSMQYDSEAEFLEHYRSLHSEDYCCVEDASASPAPGPSATETKSASRQCACMGREMNKAERNSVFTRCMKRLAGEGLCSYTCSVCGVPSSSYRQVKVHMQVAHGASKQEKTFEVVCGSCLESYADVPGFHTHYHSQHCSVEPCLSSRTAGGKAVATATAPLTLDAEEISSEANAEEFEDVKHAIALSSEEAKKATEVDREMEEALKRSLQEF